LIRYFSGGIAEGGENDAGGLKNANEWRGSIQTGFQVSYILSIAADWLLANRKIVRKRKGHGVR
jgi:hypothetical protein